MSCVLLAAIGSQDKNLTLKTNEMAMQDSHSDIKSLESYLGEDYKVDARSTDRIADRIPFPVNAANELSLQLGIDQN